MPEASEKKVPVKPTLFIQKSRQEVAEQGKQIQRITSSLHQTP